MAQRPPAARELVQPDDADQAAGEHERPPSEMVDPVDVEAWPRVPRGAPEHRRLPADQRQQPGTAEERECGDVPFRHPCRKRVAEDAGDRPQVAVEDRDEDRQERETDDERRALRAPRRQGGGESSRGQRAEHRSRRQDRSASHQPGPATERDDCRAHRDEPREEESRERVTRHRRRHQRDREREQPPAARGPSAVRV